jgi:hypothetical protein
MCVAAAIYIQTDACNDLVLSLIFVSLLMAQYKPKHVRDTVI